MVSHLHRRKLGSERLSLLPEVTQLAKWQGWDLAQTCRLPEPSSSLSALHVPRPMLESRGIQGKAVLGAWVRER